MPHKCAHCGTIIDEGSPQLMSGCSCGSRVFLYLRDDYKSSLGETKRILEGQVLDDSDIAALKQHFKTRLDEGKTISLDIENILQVGDGRYLLDLHSLMKGEPVVIKEKGVYYIDLQYAMHKKE